MTRQQLEQRNEDISTRLREIAAECLRLSTERDELSNERLANATKINQLLQQELDDLEAEKGS